MASIIVAGSIFLHNKIKDKKEAKKEKKRQAYEDRYNELQREHSQHEEKYAEKRKSGASQQFSPGDGVVMHARQHSQTSLKSVDSDGPTKWVNEVTKGRQKA